MIMIIAIDFDGTCVTHAYPYVGRDIGAVPVLKKIVENGHQLILFTMRSDMRGISPVTGEMEDGGLKDAVDWFAQNNLPLYGIQTNPTQGKWTSSPKVYANYYIDDSAFGCPLVRPIGERPYVDWLQMQRILKLYKIIT